MNMDGAHVRLDGNHHWAKLHRIDGGWTAVVVITRPGTYRHGDVRFPDGSMHRCRAGFDIPMLSVGRIILTFLDSDEVGAEITRRMLALAA